MVALYMILEAVTLLLDVISRLVADKTVILLIVVQGILLLTQDGKGSKDNT